MSFSTSLYYVGVDVSAWKNLNLCEPVVNALKHYKFCEPTQVQSRALPKALEGRDIIGVAETVSETGWMSVVLMNALHFPWFIPL